MKKILILLAGFGLICNRINVVYAAVNEDMFPVFAKVPESWGTPGYWSWSGKDKDLFEEWPGESMIYIGDGWYAGVIPGWGENIIINGNAGESQTADIAIVPQNMALEVDESAFYELTYEYPQELSENGFFTICAEVPASWGVPGYWAWSDEEVNFFEEWPGEYMIDLGEGKYAGILPCWVDNVIINGMEGSVQTADIPIEAKNLTLIVDDSSNYRLVYEESEELEEVADEVDLNLTETEEVPENIKEDMTEESSNDIESDVSDAEERMSVESDIPMPEGKGLFAGIRDALFN